MSVKGRKVTGYDNLEIVTNGKLYPILNFWELTPKFQKIAKKEFDFLADTPEDMEDTSGYIIYRGQLDTLSNFMIGSEAVYKFGKNREFRSDGISGDSYFSATIVEIQRDGESVKIARLYS